MRVKTTKNELNNSSDEEQVNALRPVWQGRQDSNLRHLVLETSALPTELLPYKYIFYLTKKTEKILLREYILTEVFL